MERAVLKSKAKNQLKGNWCIAVITFLIGVIILGVLPGIMNLVSSSGAKVILSIISILIQGAIVYGLCSFSLNFANEKQVAFSDLFSGFNGKVYLKCLGLYVIMSIIISIGFIILVIPGIVLALMYSQAFFILCEDNSKSIMECLKESSNIMKGHKMEYFILQLSFLGWAILGCVTCGIAFLWVTPYQYVTCANYYKTLEK